MKKTILKTIFLCVIAVLCTYSAFAQEPTVIFNSAENTLEIKNVLPEKYEHLVLVVVTKADKNDIDFKAPNTMTDSFVITDGEIKFKIPDSFDNGKYNVFMTSENGEAETYFMYMSENNVAQLIEPVNKAKSKDDIYMLLTEPENRFAIDPDTMEDYIPKISEVFYEIKSGKTYKDPKELIHDYKVAEAVAMMRSGVKAETVMETYYSYFDADLTAYKGYSADIREKIDELLPAGNYSEKTASQIYKEACIYSEIRLASSWTMLKQTAEKYGDDIVFDKSYYNLVIDKNDIYVEMYQNRASITDFDSIKKVFADAAKTVYNREKRDENTVTSTGGGGKGGSSGGGAISVSTDLVNNISQNSKTELTDISGHWAEKYIRDLVKEEIVSGFEDQTFRPDSLITRAEFTKLAICAFQYAVGGKAKFADVDESDWFSPYAASAYESGLIKGDDNGCFRPNDYITRQETAAIVYRALKDSIAAVEADGNEFADNEEISEYAKNAIVSLFKAGVVSGFEDGSFAPVRNTTRAEAAVMIYRAVYR